jgi:D-alanine transaminase
MSLVAYVDGAYRPLSEAGVSVEDRGFHFGDAVYEVWSVRGGRILDAAGHYKRLHRSLGEIRMSLPMSQAALGMVIDETIRRNRVVDGIAYLQISRGAARRDHGFPGPNVRPTVVITARRFDLAGLEQRFAAGVGVVTMADERWARCDIKSVNLLPNVLAKQTAREKGAFEAWLIDRDGKITEGTSSNAWIVDAKGRLRTRDLSNAILHGVTRAALLKRAALRQIPVLEQAFTLKEALAAREAFLTSAVNLVMPVVAIDGRAIGVGKPGPVAKLLRDDYLGAVRAEVAKRPARGWRRVRPGL